MFWKLALGPASRRTCCAPRFLGALEIDAALAAALSARLKGSNVDVIEGDATKMPFLESEFSGVVSFTMLHHVPSQELQNKVLAEVLRVLQPGGFFVGSDSLQNWFMTIIHIGDTLVPVNPNGFAARLESVGFEVLEVEKDSQAFRFRARRPLSSPVKARGMQKRGVKVGSVEEFYA
jgi:SAM-dependent methyltransferase